MKPGFLAGLGAYILWGLFPVYWKGLSMFPAEEVLGHRVIWSVVFLMIVLVVRRRLRWIPGVLRSPRALLLSGLSGSILALNWYTFIYAVNHDRVVDASLGYFINPLLNVLLGALFLSERLRRRQFVAITIAFCAVAIYAWSLGEIPWIALTLAFTFAFYGLLRKTSRLSSMEGLALETSLLFVPALVYLGWFASPAGTSVPEQDLVNLARLSTTGIVTALPLLLFAKAARSLSLATIGMMQYLAPSMQFLLGVLVYDEPMTPARVLLFSLIWLALALFTWDGLSHARRSRNAGGMEPTGA